VSSSVVHYTDDDGFKYLKQLPYAGANPAHGLTISLSWRYWGPVVGLTLGQSVAVNTYLWDNGIITNEDFNGPVFDKIVKAIRSAGLTPDKAKILGNDAVIAIRKANGQ